MTTVRRRRSKSQPQAAADTDYRFELWRMVKMNLAIRDIEGHIEHGDSFLDDCQPDLRADYILASPPAVHTSRALAEQRDALLPGLVFGDMRAGNAI